MTSVVLVPAMASHAGALADLHAQCFVDAWDAPAMLGLLQAPGLIGLIAGGQDGPAQGFALARIAADEAEILSIGVIPGARDRGLGRIMLEALNKQLQCAGVRSVFLEVADSNSAAQALYLRAGFRLAGRRKGYYARAGRPAEDAQIFRLDFAAP